MKTAISLPDETFHRASERARALGMSRSEFFARAAERYIAQLDVESITSRIDVVIESTTHQHDSAGAAAQRGRRTVEQSSGDW